MWRGGGSPPPRGMNPSTHVLDSSMRLCGPGGRGQARAELAVDQQRPDVAEGHLADEVLDVDAAVAQGAAVLVGFGDLCLEGDDAFQAGYEVVGHLACSSARGPTCAPG